MDKLKAEDLDFVKIESINVPETQRPTNSNEPIRIVEKFIWDTNTTAINLIVKREYLFIHSILFNPKIVYGEDTMWVFWVGFFKNRHKLLNNRIYNYRQRFGSAMHSLNKKKHHQSMVQMTIEYRNALLKYSNQLDVFQLKQLKSRIYWSAQNVLFDALLLDKETQQKSIAFLEQEKIYPYPALWDRISFGRGFKNIVINIFGLPFPCKSYYKICCWLASLYKR